MSDGLCSICPDKQIFYSERIKGNSSSISRKKSRLDLIEDEVRRLLVCRDLVPGLSPEFRQAIDDVFRQLVHIVNEDQLYRPLFKSAEDWMEDTQNSEICAECVMVGTLAYYCAALKDKLSAIHGRSAKA